MSKFNRSLRFSAWKFAIVAVVLINVKPLLATDVDGFTEPYRTINVSAAEPGIITELDVKEGDSVHQGQTLALLDVDVLEVAKDIAKAGKESQGRINSATATVKLKKERLEKLQELKIAGHAHPEEVMRAEMEHDVALAELLASKEEQNIKGLEYNRIQTQIERRKIISPIDGFVTKIQKEVSEYVAATDPVVLTVVQCDQLKVVFSVPAAEAHRFTVGKKAMIRFSADVEPAEGVVELVSKVTDPESGTVRVKVVINNAQGRYRSGMACFLTITPPQTPAGTTDKNG
jgi:membrane fusion protein, multidrug efflux system